MNLTPPMEHPPEEEEAWGDEENGDDALAALPQGFTSTALYDEEVPSPSSPQPARRRKSRALSRMISAAFNRSKRGDFDDIVGQDPETVSDEALMPIVDDLKREYDKNEDGNIDEEEMVRMLLGAIRMGMKKRSLADENSHLVKKASYLHIYQYSSFFSYLFYNNESHVIFSTSSILRLMLLNSRPREAG